MARKDFLPQSIRREQPASYCSRLAESRRKNGNLNGPDINTVADAFPTAEEDEDLCDMEQCLEDMHADDEMMPLQDSLAPIADDTSDSRSSSTGHAVSQPNDQLKFQVRNGVEGKEVKVCGDGWCMFRSVAVYLDQTLQKCMRSGSWPLQQQLASKETSAADNLQNQTLAKMVENEEIYQKKNEEQGYDKDFDANFGNFQERLKQMKNPSVYAGEEELMALVDVVLHPIHVHQSAHKNCYEDVCEQAAAPTHLRFTPENAATGNTPKVPAHYDLLLDTLYPKTGDFAGLKFGRKKWYLVFGPSFRY